MKTFDKKPGDNLSGEEINAVAHAVSIQESDALAVEIGRYQLAWAQMEMAVTIVLRAVTEKADAFEFSAIAAPIDIYRKTDLLVTLARRRDRPNDLIEDLNRFRRQLHGKMREYRNRLIHDSWLIDADQFQRITYRAKIIDDRPTAFEWTPVKPADIREAYAQIFLAIALLKNVFGRIDRR